MFNIGAGEITLILVVALLVLGPQRLPELARGLGKFMRAFRRQTDEVRSVIEREFYRMDQDVADFKADFDVSKPPRPSLAPPEPIPEPSEPMHYPPHDEYGRPLPPTSEVSASPDRDSEGTQVIRSPSEPPLALEESPTHVGPRGTVPVGSGDTPPAFDAAEIHDEVTQVQERSPADAPALPDEDPLGRNRNPR